MWESQRQLWAFVLLSSVLTQAVHATPFYVPQFLSGGVGRNIRHLPCVSRRSGETGVCMFAFTCAKANGTHLGTCIDRFYFGSCCKIDDEPDMFPQDNSIDDGPHPPRPFVTTHAPIESNDIPEYFSRPKPIAEKKPPGTHATVATTYVTDSTQAPSTTPLETTTATTKKPEQTYVETTTQTIRLSTFQTVQDGSTKRVTTTEAPLKTSTKTIPTTQRPIITTGSSPATRPSPATSSSTTVRRPTTSSIPARPTVTSFTVQNSKPSTRKPPHSSTVHKPSTQRPTSSSSHKPSQSTTNKIGETATARPQTTTTRSATTQKYVPSTRFPLRNTTTTVKPSSQTVTKKPTTSSTKRPQSTRRPSVTTRKPSTPAKRPTGTGKPLTGSTFTSGKPNPTTSRPQTTVKVRPPVVTVTESSSTSSSASSSRPVQSTQSAQPSTLTTSTLTTSKVTGSTTRKPTQRITTTTRRPIEQKTTTRKPTERTTTRRPDQKTTIRPVEKTTVKTTLKPTTTKQKPTRITTTQKVDTTVEVTTTPTIFATTSLVTEKIALSSTSESRPRPTKPTRPSSAETRPSTAGTKPTSSIGTKPSSAGTRPSSAGTRPSSVGTRPSSVGTKPPSVGTKPSSVGTKPPSVGTRPSSVGTKPTTTRITTTSTTTTTTTTPIPIPTTVTFASTSTESTAASVNVPVTTDVSSNGTVPSTVPPLKVADANQTLEEIPQTTYSPGLVTWSSNSDLLTTKVAESSTVVAEQEEQTETEWTPITTPDGWIIIQSPTTETLPQTQEETTTTATSTKTTTTATTTTTSTSTSKPVTEPTVQHLTSARPVTESSAEYVTKKPSTPSLQTTMTGVTIDTELPVPMETLNMSDYKQVCGRRLFPEPRIVGGKPSTFGKWPWQISLRQWRTSTYLHKCGAALLNENWAITAAHCVENVPPSDLLLRIGEHDLANEDEPYGYQERRVQIVASHPQFDPRTFEYDLALLRFYEPLVPFQPNVLPICLPDDDENYVGRTAYVTGWGRLYDEGPLPSVLQEVEVPVINNSVCESMYRNAGYIEHIPNIFICAGWKNGGFDSCEGDSGGPMVIQRARDKRWILAGVISWGIGCAVPNQPGVYTRISEFRDWINQILQF